MPQDQSFAKRLKTLRERAKLNQAQLADAAGLDPNLISRYERGSSMPMLQTIEKLAASLGVGVSELLQDPEKEEFEVKIIMGVKSLIGTSGIAITDDTFFYGVEEDNSQIQLGGRINISTLEKRKEAIEKLTKKFWQACWMYDHRNDDIDSIPPEN